MICHVITLYVIVQTYPSNCVIHHTYIFGSLPPTLCRLRLPVTCPIRILPLLPSHYIQHVQITHTHTHISGSLLEQTTHTHTHICQNPIPDYDVAVPLLSEQDILQHCLTAVVRTNDVSLSLCLSAFPPPLHQ